jgi:hypothetical protein
MKSASGRGRLGGGRVEPQEYDEIMRSLVQIAAHQDTINERLPASIERIETTLAHVEITQARMETLLARMLPTQANGRDA